MPFARVSGNEPLFRKHLANPPHRLIVDGKGEFKIFILAKHVLVVFAQLLFFLGRETLVVSNDAVDYGVDVDADLCFSWSEFLFSQRTFSHMVIVHEYQYRGTLAGV